MSATAIADTFVKMVLGINNLRFIELVLVRELLKLEFPHSEGEATVGGQVGVAEEGELRPKLFGFGERFTVKEADADQLPCRLDQDLIVAGLEHIEPEDFDFLVNLLGLQLVGLLALHRLGLIEGLGQIHFFQQLGVIEPVGVLFEQAQGKRGGFARFAISSRPRN